MGPFRAPWRPGSAAHPARNFRCDVHDAPVAQLDRAPDYESGGQEFESLRARHNCFYRLPFFTQLLICFHELHPWKQYGSSAYLFCSHCPPSGLNRTTGSSAEDQAATV